MKRLVLISRTAAWMATCAMVAAPRLVAAAETVGATPQVRVADVALDADGALHGQAATPQGRPIANALVVVDDGRSQWTTTTNDQGLFRVDGLRGGGYRVQAAGQTQFCRAWTAAAAPPSANSGLLVVPGDATVLGQNCGRRVGCGTGVGGGGGGGRAQQLLSNPLVIGGIVAAAIAIPIAVTNSDDDPAS